MDVNELAVKDLTTEELQHLYDLFARTNGYTQCPPNISEFISSEYYLGSSLEGGSSVFPFWKEHLVNIYPTPFYESNKFKVILLSGATGTGKCHAYNQTLEFLMNEDDISKYGLDEYIVT